MAIIRISVVLLLVAIAVAMAAQPVMPAASPNLPSAQIDAQKIKTFASALDVQTLLAKAKVDRKEGQAIVSEHILSLAPYNINLEYRPTAGAAAVHEKEAELIYVIDGSGTLTTGGELLGERRTNPSNLVGTAIEGGTTQTIAKGDFMIVPEGTPHQVSAVDGVLVLMSFHVPRPIPSGQ